MKYIYKKTSSIYNILQKIERAKILIEELPVSPVIEDNIRRTSLLKSSLFSARIEGNKLNLNQVLYESLSEQSKSKMEVANILRALKFIRSKQSARYISLLFIKKLHTITMQNLLINAGNFRTEVTGIFNQAGVAVYLTPPVSEIKPRLQQLISYTKNSKTPIPIISAISHFSFEKIHPFVDGNGRVGRLVSKFILDRGEYGMKGLVSFEEFLDKNKQQYYDYLLSPKKDITDFILFFLEGIVQSAENVIDQLKNRSFSEKDTLLPKRREILEIIHDHRQVSFDFLKRRFLRVSPSTIHYDLQQLLKVGLIKKLGKTRGVIYVPKIN